MLEFFQAFKNCNKGNIYVHVLPRPLYVCDANSNVQVVCVVVSLVRLAFACEIVDGKLRPMGHEWQPEIELGT